ncbi:zf-HC2 domain-containing protein [bacterium]|nr:zf-HC2 domain-containing protein [bacterium]
MESTTQKPNTSATSIVSSFVLTCRDVEDLSSLYLDGEMIDPLKIKFEAHLDACHDCKHLIEDLKLTSLLARELALKQIPAGVSSRLRQALKEKAGFNGEATGKSSATLKSHLKVVRA